MSKTSVEKLSIGTWKYFDDEGFGREILAAGYELGVRRFDTARSYVSGMAERNLGLFLQTIQDRDSIFVSTKAFGRNDNAQPPLSQVVLRDSILRSLDALKLNYVDCLYLHNYVPEVNLVELSDAILGLMSEQKIKAFGFCHWPSEQIRKFLSIDPALNDAEFFVQTLHNLLTPLDETLIKKCRLVAYSPLARGLLTDKNNFTVNSQSNRFEDGEVELLDVFLKKKHHLIADIKMAKRKSLENLAYSYVFNNKHIDHVCCGFSSVSQLQSLVSSLRKDFYE